MIRMFISALAAMATLVGGASAHAQGQPVTWRYQMQDGVSTATYPGDIQVAGIVKGEVKTPVYTTTVQNFPQTLGSSWYTQGHPNWNIVQTRQLYNPTEWQVYSNAAQGIARVVSGTNQVVRVSGTPFDVSWIGLPFFYWEGSGYTVASVTDADHLTVTTTGGGAVSWGATANGTFFYVTTSSQSVCNVIGTSVTWTSGDPFMPFAQIFKVNGVTYPATWNSQTQVTLGTGAGVQPDATCTAYSSIADELTNIRLQALGGSSEENFVITEAPKGATIQTAYTGQGKYRPIWIGAGENPVGTFNPHIGIHPAATLGNPGWTTLGGDNGNQVAYVRQDAQNVNYMQMDGGRTGLRPSISGRGANANVGLAFDIQGTERIAFSSGSFTRPEFSIFGNGGACSTGVNSTATAGELSSQGATTCNLALIPGTDGVVYSARPFQLASFTVATLPTCNTTVRYSMAVVTDATAPTYNGALTGGGAVTVPVFCNGTAWTSH